MIKITFFTGSGISAASGIPTFRDSDGLWNNFNPQEVCSLRGYNRDRKKVLDFHNEIRRVIDKSEPNAAHRAIAQLEKKGQDKYLVTVVTQNIDDLHERAGSQNIIKIHGDIHKARLKRFKNPTLPWTEDILPQSHPPGWESCLGTMRHDVVFFGEQIKHSKEAAHSIKSCDFLVVCGTSLAVYPAAGFVLDATRPHKIYVDRSAGEDKRKIFNHVIEQEASIGIPLAIDYIFSKTKLSAQ